MDNRPLLALDLDAFGADAIVMPPGGPSLATRIIWQGNSATDVPGGAVLKRAERRRVMSIPVLAVSPRPETGAPEIPLGTIVTVAEFDGGEPTDWKIDAAERTDFDHYRCVVVPA